LEIEEEKRRKIKQASLRYSKLLEKGKLKYNALVNVLVFKLKISFPATDSAGNAREIRGVDFIASFSGVF
jgi:ribosomal protein L15